MFRPSRNIFKDLQEHRAVPSRSQPRQIDFGPIADLFWTRQLVELSADLYCELLEFLPAFLLGKFIVDQRADMVV